MDEARFGRSHQADRVRKVGCMSRSFCLVLALIGTIGLAGAQPAAGRLCDKRVESTITETYAEHANLGV